MICPCCGQTREIQSVVCAACGARQVGPALAQPDVLLPKLGLPIAALASAALIVTGFLALWLFGSDMKVGRALLVWTLGDGTEFTRKLLETDPKLLAARIFSFHAYKAALPISFGAIPLSMLGVWLARRGRRLAASAPAQYGGARLAQASFALSLGLLGVFSAVALAAIPDAVARGRARRVAATNVEMYRQAAAIRQYHREYGAYPAEIADLSRIDAESTIRADYWRTPLAYEPIQDGVIASRGVAISYSSYKLVSAGPDEKFGTGDDVTMIDGVIVDTAPAAGSAGQPEKPRP
jgi:hypothetical protein